MVAFHEPMAAEALQVAVAMAMQTTLPNTPGQLNGP